MPMPIFDTQDAVPEAFRAEYEERDGKWHPKVPDVTKLTTALDSERTRATNEEKARKAAERERDELKRKNTASEHNISEEQLKALREEDEKKRKPLEDEAEKLRGENRRLKLTDRVRSFASKHGIKGDRLDDAMLVLERRTDLAEGGDSIVVKDKDGKVTTETIDDFLKATFKKEKPWYYGAPASSGSGADASDTSGGGEGTAKTAAEVAKTFQQRRDAKPNPLLPAKKTA